ncbi:MAG: hypothetical protein ACLU98_11795 [Desulfovibrio fairfieldensis]
MAGIQRRRDNPHNGSERLPCVATTNNLTNSLSSFGYRGNPIMGGGKGVLGTNPNGTWGVGARIKRLSFMDDLSHTLRVNYFGGTNNPKMAAYITGRRPMDGAGRAVYRNNTDFNSFGTYLTRSDSGLEINFDSTYKAAENLSFILETGYIHLWLDEGTWGRYENIAGDSLNYKDAWKVSLNVIRLLEHVTLEMLLYGEQSPPTHISRQGFADSLKQPGYFPGCFFLRLPL